jgi:hypothetical protein
MPSFSLSPRRREGNDNDGAGGEGALPAKRYLPIEGRIVVSSDHPDEKSKTCIEIKRRDLAKSRRQCV